MTGFKITSKVIYHFINCNLTGKYFRKIINKAKKIVRTICPHDHFFHRFWGYYSERSSNSTFVYSSVAIVSVGTKTSSVANAG